MKIKVLKNCQYLLALYAFVSTISINAMSVYPDGTNGGNIGDDEDDPKKDEWNHKNKSPRNRQIQVINDASFVWINNLHSSTPITILIKDETGSIVYEQFIAPETTEVTIPIMDFPTGNYQLEVFSDSMDYVLWPITKY